jgi:hypothetical protein
MWSLGERNGLQKRRCGFQKRGTAYKKGDVVSRRYERLTEREMWTPEKRNGNLKKKN